MSTSGRPSADNAVLAGATVKEMQRMHWLEPGCSGWGSLPCPREDGRTCVGTGPRPRSCRDLRLLPSEKIAIIVLMNAEAPGRFSTPQRATALLVPAIAAVARGPTPRADPSLSKYLGRYRTLGDSQVLSPERPADHRSGQPDPTEGMGTFIRSFPHVQDRVAPGYGSPESCSRSSSGRTAGHCHQVANTELSRSRVVGEVSPRMEKEA